MRRFFFQKQFREDLDHWIKVKPKLAVRLLRIVYETANNPSGGIGKPERIGHLGANVWSKRLTEADRVVYAVYDDYIDFWQGRYHYDDK